MFYAYILKSEKDGKYYFGSYADLELRLKAHNGGKVRSTKGRRPLLVHYFEEFETKQEALRREMYFKSIDGYLFLRSSNIIK